ncbi:MAG: cation:proton antiporter [Hyphomicrobiales bacterium]
MEAHSLAQSRDVLVVLGAASLAVPLLRRLGISTILGFMLVGICLGPWLLGAAVARLLPQDGGHLINTDAAASLADLGVVFLLFLIGLELSPARLFTMKRLVFGLGGAQAAVSVVLLTLAAMALGFGNRASLVLGFALSLSSTAIAVQIFTDAKRLGSQAGRASFAILLLQDLSVIPMLMLVGIMASPETGSIYRDVGLTLLQATVAIAAILAIGQFLLRPLLRMVVQAEAPEFFLAAVLFIAIGTGALATAAGLSMSLGAFIAGLMLAETEYRRAVEAILEPFKGLLLGLFFLLVGMGLDLGLLIAHPFRIIAAAVALVALKALVLYGLARAFRLQRHAALETSLLLGPGGEFAFVLLNVAMAGQLLPPDIAKPALLIVTLSMMVLPLLARFARPAVEALRPATALPDLPRPDFAAAPEARVLIAGFGRVGSLTASLLTEHGIPWLAIDSDPTRVALERGKGLEVYFGNASDPAFLRACGIGHAKAFAVTMDSPSRVDDIVKAVRQESPTLRIIARARDERHGMRLYELGVTEAVPETVESSLQLGEALLVEAGVPMGLAIATVHERRDGFRKLLGRPNRREAVASMRRRLANRMPKQP